MPSGRIPHDFEDAYEDAVQIFGDASGPERELRVRYWFETAEEAVAAEAFWDALEAVVSSTAASTRLRR